MATQHQLRERFDTETLDHLIDAEVPVLSGMQRQGDVLIVPMRAGKVAGLAPVGPEGIVVVRGENGGNTHLLVADGPVAFAPTTEQRGFVRLGTLVVEKDATAFLTHPEHGFMGIAPGTYLINRQREQAEEIRLVAD